MGAEHLKVIYGHQRKMTNPVGAGIASFMRFIVARSMTGIID
jgi:hypothetical protein